LRLNCSSAQPLPSERLFQDFLKKRRRTTPARTASRTGAPLAISVTEPHFFMIRTACAWALVVLAASPVTAPFSACDLQALAAPTLTARTMSMAPAAVETSSPLSLDNRANNVSPVLTPREPTAESRAGSAVLLFPGVFAASRDVDRPPQVCRGTHDRPTQVTVLRL
jgi:hypothetical protein